MFSPEDLKIVKESPGIRRRFIDMELSQLNKRYYHNLVQSVPYLRKITE